MPMGSEYDITGAFKAVEDELVSSMIRNMARHRAEETDEGYNWAMWQAEQLKALEKYKRGNQKKYGGRFRDINAQIDMMIYAAREQGGTDQEQEILRMVKNGFEAKKAPPGSVAEFFKLNEQKLEALIKATREDMQKAETAVLRRANDQYRQVIFNAQVYANTGAGTYEKAVDMATKDFLKRGIDCIQYANGSRHTIADYADMAIRTASKRAYLQGEGEKRREWGICTVIVNKRGNPCPKCLPHCGKVYIDDVWSGGPESGVSPRTGIRYPLISSAVAGGLYHPRCKDSHTTYFEGVSTPPDSTYTKAELRQAEEDYRREQKAQYAGRQAEKYGRLAEYSLDGENKKQYRTRADEWRDIYLREKNLDGQYCVDITEIWPGNRTPDPDAVIKLDAYTVDGVIYKVDGKHVLLDYSDKELQVAKLVKEKLGGQISMVPRVLDPQGIATPDYIFRNEAFDLKELSGSSKNLVYNVLSKKKRQASNFILDVSRCPLTENEIYRQIDQVYWSNHTKFIDKIIVLKDDEIIKIFGRKK